MKVVIIRVDKLPKINTGGRGHPLSGLRECETQAEV